jgi:hypothetical protein
MNTNWKYPRKVPNTRAKDGENQVRDAMRGTGVARGAGIKQVATAGGTAIFALPAPVKAKANAAPSWV